MNVCLLVTGLGGGAVPRALLDHAGALGEDVEFVVAATEPGPLETGDERLARARTVTLGEAVAAGPFDVVLATGWRSAAALFRVPGTRHALYLAELEYRAYGPGDPEAIPAALALDLPVDFVVEGRWLETAISGLRPEARVRVVRPGVERREGDATASPRLRVLPEGSAAVEALAEMGEPHEVATTPGEADVVLMLSTRDGILGAPLAGFGLGATAVVTPVPGHDELVEHRVNGLVADPDDVRGAARWLDTLARDRDLLAELRAGAARTVGDWPTVEAAAAEFRAVLEELVASEPAPDARWPVRLMDDAIARSTVLREHMGALVESAGRAEQSAAEAQALVRAVRAPVERARARLRVVAQRPALRPFLRLWRALRG